MHAAFVFHKNWLVSHAIHTSDTTNLPWIRFSLQTSRLPQKMNRARCAKAEMAHASRWPASSGQNHELKRLLRGLITNPSELRSKDKQPNSGTQESETDLSWSHGGRQIRIFSGQFTDNPGKERHVSFATCKPIQTQTPYQSELDRPAHPPGVMQWGTQIFCPIPTQAPFFSQQPAV